VVWNRLYNDLDFTSLDWEPFEARGLEHLEAARSAGRGALVCTQHVGAYRRVFDELVRRGFRVNLLVAAHVARSMEAQFRRRRPDPEWCARLAILDAQRPDSVRAMLAALSRNEVVLVYLDGNTGVDGPGGGAQANTVTVPFFGRPVAVRRGVAQISHASGAPIVPLFASWDAGRRPSFRCLAPLWPDRAAPVAPFCERRMAELFALAEAAIRERPEQFEEWPSVRRWRVGVADADPDVGEPASVPAGDGPVRVDPRRARVLEVDGQAVLADGVHGRALKAEPGLADVVAALGRPRTVRELRARLRRAPGEGEVARAVARLAALGLLEDARPAAAQGA
jgi:lauroyl/myristoyl acyltransferase